MTYCLPRVRDSNLCFVYYWKKLRHVVMMIYNHDEHPHPLFLSSLMSNPPGQPQKSVSGISTISYHLHWKPRPPKMASISAHAHTNQMHYLRHTRNPIPYMRLNHYLVIIIISILLIHDSVSFLLPPFFSLLYDYCLLPYLNTLQSSTGKPSKVVSEHQYSLIFFLSASDTGVATLVQL